MFRAIQHYAPSYNDSSIFEWPSYSFFHLFHTPLQKALKGVTKGSERGVKGNYTKGVLSESIAYLIKGNTEIIQQIQDLNQ